MKKHLFFIVGLAFLVLVYCRSSAHDVAPKPPSGYRSMSWIKAAVVLRMEKLVNTKPEVPDSIAAFRNIVYKKRGDRELQLDIYRAKSTPASAPLLVFIHGGAWKSGAREDYLVYLLAFAAKGYVTATVSYRLGKEAVYPAAVQDVKCALRWLKQHGATYGFDQNRIALIGGSAGGHLAMMVGYSHGSSEFNGDCAADSVDDRIQAVVNIYGPCDLTTPFAVSTSVVTKFIGASYSESPQLYQQASPLQWLTPDDPPTLIFHGTIDEIVPVSQSDTLKTRLDRLAIPNAYHRLKGWPHTMDLSARVNAYCVYYMNDFFRKYLQPAQGGR
jgi:acetyl esterase/lipase